MPRLFPLFVAFLAAGLTARAEDPPLRGVAACNKALKLAGEGKPAEALKILDAAKGTMDAEDEWLWWGNKGSAHRDLRQDAEALPAYQKAVELKPDCWFQVEYATLLHEFGRFDEALKVLEKPVQKGYTESAARLRAVVTGPYRKRWPHAYKKLEYSAKAGHYQVVSNVGVDAAEMDRIEAAAAKLNPAEKVNISKLEALFKPNPQIVNIANLLELTRVEYMRLSGMKEAQWPKGKVSRVFYFQTQQEFLDFASSAGGEKERESTVGFFDPNFKDILLYNTPGGGEVFGIAKETLDTFWHEGWHQFFDVLTSQTPTWIDEGIAEYVGKGVISKDGMKLALGQLVKTEGEFVTRYEKVKGLVKDGKHVPFREFFKFDNKKWNNGDTLAHYAQAWSVVYYAMRGDNAAFQKDFRNFFLELVKGTPWLDAVASIFPDAKLNEYEKQWRAFIEKL